MMIDWARTEEFPGLGSIDVIVEVPNCVPMIRVPRQMLERILTEAGYVRRLTVEDEVVFDP